MAEFLVTGKQASGIYTTQRRLLHFECSLNLLPKVDNKFYTIYTEVYLFTLNNIDFY